ncbi:MAG: hypothetical protein A3F54_00075 [Candidatus Kerfeldbacteria bacterium RIFCSPHIGHO2_12_FULL_48_17]|uniref:GlcNAc-PI de-N-acetylase n=1 Tax=Candidatus Kerfeldbacteria bacterium RIFCSPHIGHO2_12_FULL_48_17 TaxID=1798542 RepID=A0A1G2B7W2_9BACT|nr:MAG: hypothetical protein A3F54_00075 [Candidatus Kerfeldbacteria bacterium RIFCSPHIGHO2_12_FULL_48_17]
MSILKLSYRFLRAIVIGIFIFGAGATAIVIITGHSDLLAPLLWPLNQQEETTLDVSALPTHTAAPIDQFPQQLDNLVIVAHYDDECIAVCNFLRAEHQGGKTIGVVVVTFSQGQEATQKNWYGIKRRFNRYQWRFINFLHLKPADRTDYGLTREAETDRVLDALNIPKKARHYMRYPDLGTEKLLENPQNFIAGDYNDPLAQRVEKYRGEDLKQELASIIKHSHPKRILTHLEIDSHSDHRAVGKLVSEILIENATTAGTADTTAETTATTPEEWQFLIHWSHKDAPWVPEKYPTESAWLTTEPTDFFNIPDGSADGFDPTPINVPTIAQPQKLKTALLSLYTTQTKFEPEVLSLFTKKNELFWDIKNKKIYNYVYGGESKPKKMAN